MPPHVTFVCVRNRVRSTFAEFYLTHMFRDRAEKPAVSSAGFMPRALQDQLGEARIPIPEPFFNRPMSSVTRAALGEKGVRAPHGWRSKALTLEMIEKADLLVTALGEQKEELAGIYEDARNRIFSIRELSGREDYLLFEDFSAPALDENYWHYVEEDPEFVSKVLRAWEETLIMAFPNIMKQLGCE
jgi:protein-tyrosine-phosphatase